MVSIQDVIKVYPGPIAAVRGVSLEIGKGLFGLLGPNGAGKTTFMKVIATLLEPTAGRFVFDGVDGVADPLFVRRRLGYLPQDFGFYPNLSARAMLNYLAALKGVALRGRRRLLNELLERTNLAHVAGRRLGTFSGGMRQRFGIAQALIGSPDLLIVDEPTAGLDPLERVRFYNLLGELARERVVLLSTHIVEDVRVLCKRFAIMRDGRLVYHGTPAELLASIQGRVFEGFVPRERVQSLEEESVPIASTVITGETGTYRVRVVLEEGAAAPADFAPAQPTLEDGYAATGFTTPAGDAAKGGL
ncbi:MAG: ABC transporter ATP-binding protein [Planctomycetota bacterium]